MLSKFSSVAIIFYTLFLLLNLQLSQQYTYPCNASASCGCSSNPATVSKIVGGESAGASTWSWIVSISIDNTSLCGGAILSNSWIITAAHCMFDVSASEIIIYAGSNTKYSGQFRVASRIIVHPNYNTSTYENDIAIIQLSNPLTMTNTVRTICIPSISSSMLAVVEWPSPNLYVVAVGWGTLSEGGLLPSVLQQVTLQTIDYNASMCRFVLYNQRLQFCAGVFGGGKGINYAFPNTRILALLDTCQGDSGGPLMMYTASEQWVLVGVTSYGRGCAREDYAGVYTRVAAYQSWIATITGNAYTNPVSSNSSIINIVLSNGTTTITTSTITTSTRKSTASIFHSQYCLFPFILFYFLHSN